MALFFIFSLMLGAALQLTNAYGDSFLQDDTVFPKGQLINNFSEKPQNAAIDLKSSSIGEMSKFTDLTQSSLKIDLKKSVVKVTKITPYSTIILKLE